VAINNVTRADIIKQRLLCQKNITRHIAREAAMLIEHYSCALSEYNVKQPAFNSLYDLSKRILAVQKISASDLEEMQQLINCIEY